jgi:glycosyltransferase involved in cell wall biosynthesis
MKILHVVIGLDIGGAEIMMFRLVQSGKKHKHIVVSLTTEGKLGEKLSLQGIEVHALGLTNLLVLPLALVRLVKLINTTRPDVVQTWMYHSDLIGGFAAKWCGVNRIHWGIRSTQVPNARISLTRLAIWLGAKLSYFLPTKIVCCAESVRIEHLKLGYCPEKMLVIENGYDVKTFLAARSERQWRRDSLEFKAKDIIIGIVGRFDYLKDYKNFVEATGKVARGNEHVKFLMVGRNINFGNDQLRIWIENTGFRDRYILLDEREDIPGLLSAMDIFCLSSRAEGFPNVIAEAMACKLPCVVTDVGDAAKIVGATGVVVPPENSDALACALLEVAAKNERARSQLGEKAMLLIEEHYSINSIVMKYEQLYENKV